jgi:hypothetical protein
MCHAYKKKCEDEYKELHYNKGVELFAEEKLIEAIEEWEKVKALDPNFRRVDYSIHKAKTMLRNLDRLKQNQ